MQTNTITKREHERIQKFCSLSELLFTRPHLLIKEDMCVQLHSLCGHIGLMHIVHHYIDMPFIEAWVEQYKTAVIPENDYYNEILKFVAVRLINEKIEGND